MATVLRKSGLLYGRKGGAHGQLFVWDRAREGTVGGSGKPAIWLRRRRRQMKTG